MCVCRSDSSQQVADRGTSLSNFFFTNGSKFFFMYKCNIGNYEKILQKYTSLVENLLLVSSCNNYCTERGTVLRKDSFTSHPHFIFTCASIWHYLKIPQMF